MHPDIMKHKYTLEFYKSHYNEEMFQLTNDYEKNVHKRKPDSMNAKFVQEFMAYSPIFDHEDASVAYTPSPWEDMSHETQANKTTKQIQEEHRVQYPPSSGSYHIYHRIDGELVAIGICEITDKYFNSGYFMYKTKYAYLNLGVVGAIVELEFCRKLKEIW